MDPRRNVAVLVGSLREASWSRKLAHALFALAPAPLALASVEIGQLPLYNEDWEVDPHTAVLTFRRAIGAADAVLFVTPEYNRSVPGVLKNAIDVGSRPPGKSAWRGKPGAVISLSRGALGGFGANHHLRQSMVFLDVAMLQMPEAYVGHVPSLFDERGELANDATREFLQRFLGAFAAWIERTAPR
jgi:chromate reductase